MHIDRVTLTIGTSLYLLSCKPSIDIFQSSKIYNAQFSSEICTQDFAMVKRIAVLQTAGCEVPKVMKHL